MIYSILNYLKLIKNAFKFSKNNISINIYQRRKIIAINPLYWKYFIFILYCEIIYLHQVFFYDFIQDSYLIILVQQIYKFVYYLPKTQE